MPGEREIAQALLTNYEPSLRDRVGNAIYDVARSLGMSSTANRMRNDAMSAVDFVPMVGDAIGFDDAINDFRAGNYGMGAAGLGLTAVGVVPGVGDAVANAGRKGIRAFHGSPHDFDRFDMSKIGTGEGAQAYGHGLYFAESEDVARSYRDALQFPRIDGASTPIEQVADDLNYYRGNVDAVISSYEGMLARGTPEAQAMAREKLAALPDALERFKGRMYEVNIRANPEDFLDWDAPLSEQPQKVRDVINDIGARGLYAARETEAPFRPSLAGDPSGRQVVAGVRDAVGGTAYSDTLREAGIPGIRYLDAGSRGAEDGSRNFVVFDDSLIEIVKKYGLAGAVAAGLISQQMAEQMEQQGMGEI